MVDQPLNLICPECGKPLTKNKGKAWYNCGNSACSVISVRFRHPDNKAMEIQYEARARS